MSMIKIKIGLKVKSLSYHYKFKQFLRVYTFCKSRIRKKPFLFNAIET